MIDQKKLDAAIRFIRKSTNVRPSVALILGSGLGEFADQLTGTTEIPTVDIPYYPRSTVQGHEGKLVFGHITRGRKKSPPLVVFKGRVHFYETGSLPLVTLPAYLASALGAKTLLVTNAAGGINRKFSAGDLMIIRDILDLTFTKSVSKRVAHEKKQQGFERAFSRKPCLFDTKLMAKIRTIAERLDVELQEGTYCWLKGPTYETAAEIEMLRRLGADAVGMSTVPEVLAANNLGLKVAGISLISNLATGITGEKLSHAEVTTTAKRVKQRFTSLLKEVLLTP